MAYQAQDYTRLLGSLDGISDITLHNHFKLYQGYVTNTNLLIDTLRRMEDDGKAGTPECAEVTRRFGFEFNGMRLHEFYFENLGGGGALDAQSALGRLLAEEYGSLERWQENFLANGKMRGVGWALLYHDTKANRLLNTWIGEHEIGHLAGERPILVLDVWEHAYYVDYQTERPKYLQAFLRNINWPEVMRRFDWTSQTMRKAA
jgi:Fe-Mn family superoxide dismutase